MLQLETAKIYVYARAFYTVLYHTRGTLFAQIADHGFYVLGVDEVLDRGHAVTYAFGFAPFVVIAHDFAVVAERRMLEFHAVRAEHGLQHVLVRKREIAHGVNIQPIQHGHGFSAHHHKIAHVFFPQFFAIIFAKRGEISVRLGGVAA